MKRLEKQPLFRPEPLKAAQPLGSEVVYLDKCNFFKSTGYFLGGLIDENTNLR